MCAASTAQKPKEKTAQAGNKKSDNPKSTDTKIEPCFVLIEKLRASHIKRERKHRVALREDICTAYVIGKVILSDIRNWRVFVEKGDWDGIAGAPKINEEKQAVRFALKYMVGPGESAQKDANFYYRAIAPFVEQRVDAAKLRKILEETPLKTLVDKHAKEKKDARSAAKPVIGQKATRPPDSKGSDVTSEKVTAAAPKTPDGSVTAQCTMVFSEKVWISLAATKVGQKIAIKAKIDASGNPILMSVTSVKPRSEEKVD